MSTPVRTLGRAAAVYLAHAVAGAVAGGTGTVRLSDAEPAAWRLAVDGGSEVDTNIHRIEEAGSGDAPSVTAPLARAGARLNVSWRDRDQRLTVAGLGAAKLFATADGQDENALTVLGDGSYERALPGRDADIGVRGSYYESFDYAVRERLEPAYAGRSFATGNAEAQLTARGPDSHRLTAHAGYRTFRFKPDPLLDWSGDHYGLRYRATAWRGSPDRDIDAAAVDLDVWYRLERRRYGSAAFQESECAPAMPAPPCYGPARDLDRADVNHLAGAEIAYTGERIYSARYELSVTDSNSFGQSLVRHRVELGLTAELGRGVFMTAKLALQLSSFGDPLLLEDPQMRTFTLSDIDAENRNAASVYLTKDLSDRLSLEGRYALFANEFGGVSRFRRHTAYAGVVYAFAP